VRPERRQSSIRREVYSVRNSSSPTTKISTTAASAINGPREFWLCRSSLPFERGINLVHRLQVGVANVGEPQRTGLARGAGPKSDGNPFVE
jgi:hypothetical protein